MARAIHVDITVITWSRAPPHCKNQPVHSGGAANVETIIRGHLLPGISTQPSRRLKAMAHIITLANAKGGCGKTTVALNLAVCFARAGYRTLAIDLDQQGNLSAGLGVDLNHLSFTAHRLLINETPEIRRYFIEIRPNLKLLPNTIDIEADDLLEAKKVNRELLLRRQLKPVLPDFDVVLIDTPPAMRAATTDSSRPSNRVDLLDRRQQRNRLSIEPARKYRSLVENPSLRGRPSTRPRSWGRCLAARYLGQREAPCLCENFFPF